MDDLSDPYVGAQSPVVCVIDEFDPTGVRGWAVDVVQPDRRASLHVLIDRQDIGAIVCDRPRDDLIQAGYPREVGFQFTIPEQFLDGAPHRLEIRVHAQPHAPLPFIYNGEERAVLEFSDTVRPRIQSHVDDLDHGAIVGWVLREDADGRARGGGTVLVTCGDEVAGHAKADRFRPDIAATRDADAYCGFRFTPPAWFRRMRPRSFRLFLLPEKIELAGSPFVTSFLPDAHEAKLTELAENIDRAEAAIIAARQQIISLMPRRRWTLADYDEWARRYLSGLRERVPRDASAGPPEPLVSIVCPVHRPHAPHFTAAVESVIAQTYRNWELILVDDASDQPELRAQINAFALRDPRIRTLRRQRNGGISVATNAALARAKGAFVAFLDHDDLLVDVAIAVMVAQARRTGARLLYSDEDKIDDAGHFSEPHFKPDWNARLLLGNNYVCHLLMVERALLKQAGGLDPAFDGAQDHDLVLRLGERLRPGDIHHVPEILYHWRKAARSTAATPAAKPYAVSAGVRAVATHLARRGSPAHVATLGAAAQYRVGWRIPATPRVAVIVPFKDGGEITRRCVERVLEITAYPDFELILVDNWSTEPETLAFLDSLRADERVRLLRVEEEFNFARLNNLAAATTDAAFLVLLNNDVLHSDPAWLRTLVAEASADPTVAVVGAKLLYPSGYVQHGGILLGLWGVAGHVHNGLPADAPGYAGRAVLAQELSAVTGACMLIRAAVYRELGGLDEAGLPVAFNDVDFCLRARAAGHKVVFTPDVVAEHHESLSRGADDAPAKAARFAAECRLMQARWSDLLRRDPHYNPKFDLEGEAFRDLREPS